MRPSRFLFIASAVLLLTLAGSFFLPPVLRPAADAHPDFPSLEQTVTSSRAVLVLGYAMGLAVLATLGASVALGVGRSHRSAPLERWLAAGFICLGLIFTALIVSYSRYAAGTVSGLFLGLPAPTAWMLYGMWLFPVLMVLACVVHFDCYFSDADAQSFDTLIRAKSPDEETPS